jgi:hypothetical protein
MTPPRPLPAAEKQRRYRERQKRGFSSVRVDVPPQAIPALVALGLPQKLRRREDGTLPIPGLYDISGSANFANKADFGIVVHRDLKTGRTTISVRKCRFKHLGKIGDAELEYDVPTGCYRPYRKAGLS